VKRTWVGLLFAMSFPTVMAWLYFVALAQSPALGSPAPVSSVAGPNRLAVVVWFGGKAIQFAFPLFWIWCIERRRVWPAAPSFRGLVPGVVFGGLVAAGTFALYFGFLRHSVYMRDTPAKLAVKVHEFGLESPARFILFVAFLTVIHSFFEEYYWRWFVFGGLRQRLAFWSAVVWSNIPFLAYHVIDLAVFFPGKFWTMAVPLALCVGVGGAFWCWIYERSGSLYSPWLSHLLIDAAIMTVGYDLVFGQR
jgi:membrane protease YdiL (CAAX protease family)